MEGTILILNLSDEKDSAFESSMQSFLDKHSRASTSVSSYRQYDDHIFKKEVILKIILYFNMTDISEDDLSRRLIRLNQSYAPFHDQVYIRDNDLSTAKNILKDHFLYTHLYSEENLKTHLEEVFDEEALVDMPEQELYPIWQDILNGVYVVEPSKIEAISSDLNSVYMRGVLYMKKNNRRTAFEILKNLFLTHQKYFPVIELLKEFEDMKDELPMEYYLNYKLFNKIKQGKVNYLKEEEEKKRERSKFKGVPNDDKTLRKSQFKGLPNVDKSLKTSVLNYRNFEDLKRKLGGLKKPTLEEMRMLNETANQLSREGKYREAIAIYKKVYRHIDASKRYKILLNISLAYKRAEDWKACLHYADSTLKYDPKNPKALDLKQLCEAKLFQAS
ncbi:hypothetical protein [Pseudobacteriovorax antillogorgiicola]|uniref:Uncharacterized protein n=1 Tax=Pseudobacteriovorax antillogorgiicola TaxID=1513793 RepID=A0A1Y6BRK3_9BACT|nr:hypothetical protein [Pseudobacteriovorax antillogorgiicola]TCS53141.1 hypothetical protein EDD56_108192 [Pseudobacteriovorax antillogorgiicola]SMF25272.1 hypothetical protein SAMN06296036_10854 [Pseudobacteriovorax antillogorgiicola]